MGEGDAPPIEAPAGCRWRSRYYWNMPSQGLQEPAQFLQQQTLIPFNICFSFSFSFFVAPSRFRYRAVWFGWRQIGSTSGRQARRGAPELDGGCEMRCAEMTEPSVSQGAPTAEEGVTS